MARKSAAAADTSVKGSALDKGKAYLTKIFKTKDLSNHGLVPVDPNIYKQALPHIPTGSLITDFAIGGEPNDYGVAPCPGFPRGRVIQIWGHESSGKTTLALTAAATCIANGGTVLFVDFEHELVAGYAKALGVPVEDDSKFMWVQPNTLEEGFQIIKVMILTGVDMIIVDSVGAAAPTSMVTQEIADIGNAFQPGLIARGWNDFWMTNKPLLTKSQASFVALAQMRSIIGATGFQKKTKPQGGNIWKFISSIRIELARVGTEKLSVHNALTHKTDKRVQVAKIKIKIVKSKLSMSAGHEAEFYIRWGKGIDDARSLLEIAVAHNLFKKSGAWLIWNTPEGVEVKGNGKDQMLDKIKADESLVDSLYSAVLPYLATATPDEDLYDEDAEEEDLFDDPASKDAVKELEKMVAEADALEKKKAAEESGFEEEENE